MEPVFTSLWGQKIPRQLVELPRENWSRSYFRVIFKQKLSLCMEAGLLLIQVDPFDLESSRIFVILLERLGIFVF